MLNKLFLLFIVISLMSCNRQEPLTLTFVGDVILDRGVRDETRLYGDSIIENSMRPFFNSDFNFINLETVLTNQDSTKKIGYSFRYDPKVSIVLGNSNVTHASLANNHSYDFGISGFQETISALNSRNIRAIGVECKPLIIIKSGQSIGILTSSLVSNNDRLCIKHKKDLLNKVNEFRTKHSDIPLVIYLHWGLEYQQTPENWQVELAHTLIDNGADLIIGHHPHIFQSVEIYKGKPIAYSLGNFIADAYLPGTTIGAVAYVSFDEMTPTLSVLPVNLESYFPKKMTPQDEIKFLLENLKYSDGLCYYQNNDQWFLKEIAKVNFEENSDNWIFHIDNQYQISIKPLTNGSHKLTLLKNGIVQKSMTIHGHLSEIELADINNDEDVEVLLGITKRVNFDKNRKKRLNIFEIEDNGIRALWMGTHFLYDLDSYEVFTKDHLNYLHTIEIDSLNQHYSASYIWDEFGFALDHIQQTNENL